ncbi:DNA methyltransferase [Streptomyces muensis]|uniref:Methyltransferase n=1 Tax=Streptomyces muensis TaxID=1077944 RepID=A0A9X1Q4F7_STRM4|nr:DNA methyltransferase [Streptomyces muensis]MCF1597719.1 ParB N-terminal domain-containing protein [Streptomyces muensis]
MGTPTPTAAVTYLGTREIPFDQLERFPGNPRRGDIDAIRGSLRRHGQYRSLVVRALGEDQYVILAGNHTHDALKAEGYAAARCEVIECDDDQARRINLADNRLAELGTYDNDALADLLSYLDGDLDGTGYTADDVSALLGTEEEPAALTDPDDIPDAPADPHSQVGDVWILGRHRLLVGDSTDVSAVEEMLDGDRCDAMWTDPPYGVDYVGKTKDALTIQNDGATDLPELLAGAFAVATVALKPGAPVYVAHADTARITFETAMTDAGWLVRQNLIWAKDTMVLGRSDYHYRHEPILYGFTDAPAGSGRLGRGGERWYGDNAQTTVFEVPKPARNAEHPTSKPVDLITAGLRNSCRPDGLVYEPFGGSGSTLIAAHVTGRSARVVELDPRYADVICRRYQEHTGEQPVLKSTGEPHDFTLPDQDD